MTVIEHISKKDKEWRQMAYNICKCRTLADDLTNDMYIKINKYYKKAPETIKDFYIYRTIRSLYMNYLRKNPENIPIHEAEEVDPEGNDIHIGERNEMKLLEDHYTNIEYYEQIKEKRFEVDEALSKMHWYDAELLLLTKEISMRQLSRETGISLASIHHTCKQSREQLKTLLCQENNEGRP